MQQEARLLALLALIMHCLHATGYIQIKQRPDNQSRVRLDHCPQKQRCIVLVSSLLLVAFQSSIDLFAHPPLFSWPTPLALTFRCLYLFIFLLGLGKRQ